MTRLRRRAESVDSRSPRRSTARIRASSTRALDGLDHVVVGAGLQPDHDVDVVAARGQQDDRQLVGAPDAAAHLEAVDAGQHHVQHDQVRPLLAQQFQAVLARRRGGHAVALARQDEFEGRADGVVVLDQQQERHVRHSGPWGPQFDSCRRRYCDGADL